MQTRYLALAIVGLALLILAHARMTRKLSLAAPIPNTYIPAKSGGRDWQTKAPLGQYAVDQCIRTGKSYNVSAVHLSTTSPPLNPWKISIVTAMPFKVGTILNCTQSNETEVTLFLTESVFPFNTVLHNVGKNKGAPILGGFNWLLKGRFSPTGQYVVTAPFKGVIPQ